MCLAIPGKIIAIEGDIAAIDYGSEKRNAKILKPEEFNVGDFVIVQAKIVSEKVSIEQMKDWLAFLKNES